MVLLHRPQQGEQFEHPLCVLCALRVRNSAPVRVFRAVRGYGLSLCQTPRSIRVGDRLLPPRAEWGQAVPTPFRGRRFTKALKNASPGE